MTRLLIRVLDTLDRWSRLSSELEFLHAVTVGLTAACIVGAICAEVVENHQIFGACLIFGIAFGAFAGITRSLMRKGAVPFVAIIDRFDEPKPHDD